MTAPKKPIPPLTDAEEAEIQREIAADPDAPEATDAQLAKATSFDKAFPNWPQTCEEVCKDGGNEGLGN